MWLSYNLLEFIDNKKMLISSIGMVNPGVADSSSVSSVISSFSSTPPIAYNFSPFEPIYTVPSLPILGDVFTSAHADPCIEINS